MSKPKYLYIDDENGSSEVSTLHGFNDKGLVEVERFPLSSYKEFGNLKRELIQRSKSNEFDGLIIDLRLDGTGEDRTEFNAASLTQELRSVSSRGEMKTFPIILCSTEEKIRQTYNSDKTSHDLFDYKISKSNHSPNWSKLSKKLLSLAKGYNWLNIEKYNVEQILGISDLNSLEQIISEKLGTLIVNYDYTHFIIKNFFHQTNPLVNEKILAARLGINLRETPDKSWEALLDAFKSAKYLGIFSDGWDRWWADQIENIFFQFSEQKLPFLNAEKRVAILKDKIGVENLVAAKPLKFCNSSEFWTICEGYKVPLDPLEGFKICTSVDLMPWQDSKYISLLAILEREGATDRGLKPHPSETERIEYTMELLNIK